MEELFGIEDKKSPVKGKKAKDVQSSPDSAALESNEPALESKTMLPNLQPTCNLSSSSQMPNSSGATAGQTPDTVCDNNMQNHLQTDKSRVSHSSGQVNPSEVGNCGRDNISVLGHIPDSRQVENMQRLLPVIETLLQTQPPKVKDISDLETFAQRTENRLNFDQHSSAIDVTSMFSGPVPNVKSNSVRGTSAKQTMGSSSHKTGNDMVKEEESNSQDGNYNESNSEMDGVCKDFKSHMDSDQGEKCSFVLGILQMGGD